MVKQPELAKEYKGRYCLCCGRKNERIWNFLLKSKVRLMPGTCGKSVKEWKGHKLYKNVNYFYDTCDLEYCSECGQKLNQEDIKVVNESRGEFWGAPCSEQVVVGFKCSNCKYEELF